MRSTTLQMATLAALAPAATAQFQFEIPQEFFGGGGFQQQQQQVSLRMSHLHCNGLSLATRAVRRETLLLIRSCCVSPLIKMMVVLRGPFSPLGRRVAVFLVFWRSLLDCRGGSAAPLA